FKLLNIKYWILGTRRYGRAGTDGFSGNWARHWNLSSGFQKFLSSGVYMERMHCKLLG
ncbi:hypothetical protein S83_016065, partial [Arachis hypogaea]